MAERGILFSAPMVRAILSGAKTQTRRVVKPQPDIVSRDGTAVGVHTKEDWRLGRLGKALLCPFGMPGDQLWVRETWMPDPPIDDSWASTQWSGCGRMISEVPERLRHPRFCNYKADWLHGEITWRPSIHMPRWASRITLEVTGVRVERLQDISEADAIAEGVLPMDGPQGRRWEHAFFPGDYSAAWEFARNAYGSLWEKINGPGSWGANPWVWCVSFRRAASKSSEP